MDFSGDTLKSQINRDAISIMIPGVLVLTLVALILNHLNYVHLESWLSGPALVLGFVFAYVFGYVFRSISADIIIRILENFINKDIEKWHKQLNEDLHMSFYYMALRKRFRIDDFDDEFKEKETLFITNLAQDLITQKKLINYEEQYAEAGLFASLINLSILWTIFAFIAYILKLTPEWFGIVHLVIIIISCIVLIWFFYSETKSLLLENSFELIKRAGMYVLLEDKDLFVKRIKGPKGMEWEIPDYGLDKVVEESKPTDIK